MRQKDMLRMMVCVAALLSFSMYAGAGWFPHWGWGHHKKAKSSDKTDETRVVVQQKMDMKASEGAIRNVVSDYMKKEPEKPRIIHARPYYFKEYVIWNVDGDAYPVDIRKTESRTMPYTARVVLQKQRFYTKYHRKRKTASSDSNFYRASGKEILTLQLRNGHWVKAGSIFIADKVEEKVNGEWVPRREEVSVQQIQQEKQGFFSRMWSSVFGR